MRIVLLGPPGSGKGTQAKRVASHYRIPHVTSTSALADIAREDSELGRLVKETIEVNRVSDDLLAAALRVRLSQPDAAVGFVLDGFPRTVPQAETLEAVLDGIGRPIDVVILIDVDPDELMERLVGRLTCEGCGTIYNAYANPPTVDGVCDRCGGRVSRRPDDYEETIGNRLRIFESQTAQLIQHFKLRGKLRRVSGEGEPDKVFADIRHIIDSTPRTVIEMEPVSEKAEPITVLPSGLPLPPARKKAKVPAKPARQEAPPKVAPAKPAPAAPKKAAVVLAEKAPAEKAPVAKAPVEKPAGKKAVPAAKPAVAKAEPKKAPPKAGTAKKPAGKKPAVKTAAKPATAKKAATKKPPVRTAPRKAAPKAAAPKKPAGKRPAAKAVPMKTAVKKPGGRTAAKTAAPKKAAPKVPAPKKAAPKVPAAKKAAPKKVPAKKAPVKKAPARKTAKPKRR